MKTERLEEYEHIKLQIEALTTRKNELAELIIQDLRREELESYEAANGTFYLRMTPVYEYSPAVQKAEADAKNLDGMIKQMRKDEIETGIAVVSDNKIVLAFRGNQK